MFDLSLKMGCVINKKWYRDNMPKLYKKVHINYILKRIGNKKMPLYIDFVKWCLIDVLRGKWVNKKKTGIYCYVANPRQGKTISMVHHIEKDKKQYPNTRIYTNFNYISQDGAINHWSDMIKYAKYCQKNNYPCILAMDEIHITFDSSDWKNFPAEMLALLSFNGKMGVQFLCTSQIYERIPKKVRDISNYTVLCVNFLKMDRLFIDYYYDTVDYEKGFEGKRKKADFVRHFIADDYLYGRYDTLKQIDRIMLNSQEEKTKRESAFEVLFGEKEHETDSRA